MADNKLYIEPDVEIAITQIDTALDKLTENKTAADTIRIVLFIHGRGAGKAKHPEKALTQMVPFFKPEYGVEVILFNWAGSDSGGAVGFPDEEARNAAQDLVGVLQALDNYQRNGPSRCTIEFSLLTHSMGSIVLEAAAKLVPKSLSADLFHAIVISAAASKSKKHRAWIEKIYFSTNIYVLFNKNDTALKFAGLIRGRRLGKKPRKRDLSEKVTYLDLRLTGVKHRYFLQRTKTGKKTGQNENPHITHFFNAALNNSTITINDIALPSEKHPNNLFIIKTS